MIGALAGAFLGALEIWFYEFSLRRLIAAAASGAIFFAILGIASLWVTRNFLLNCITIFAGGTIAATIWWLIAQPKVPLSISIAVGIGLGFMFLVSERMTKTKM